MRKPATREEGGPRRKGPGPFGVMAALAGLLLVSGAGFAVERLNFKPGFNLFKPTQDVQIGREAAGEADKQLPLLKDPQIEQYISNLGHRLAALAPNNNPVYVWQFKVVNSSEINAFALPGGFIYVNRGAIEAAENEAEIAGVMAHESGHVVMRHGTNQASKAMPVEFLLAILGGIAGQSSSLASQVFAQLGGFGVNSWMLHNSREDEKQADEVGTYILYEAGYDPHAMARFFQIIQQKYPQQTIQFFSNHPIPENRIKDVDAEIPRLGPPKDWKTDSPEFQAVKKQSRALPPPPKPPGGPSASALSPNPPLPSSRMLRYQGGNFTIDYPDNWQAQANDNSVLLAPPGGVGDEGQAFGASISRYQPSSQGGWGLVDGTERLLDSLRQSNPNLRVVKQDSSSLQGRPALTTLLENDSPLEGQRERDRLITVRANDSLLALVFIVPERFQKEYQATFDSMVQSLELR